MKKTIILLIFFLIPIAKAIIIDQFTGYTWDFRHIENDTKLKTDIIIINMTYLELNVTERYDLPHNYKWHMALCNLSGVNELYYMEEDAQGGFNYSVPIEVNYGYLPYYGLPNNWCENTSGYGYILFSSGSVNQLPLRIRLIFQENYPMQFYLYTGDSTSVIDGSTSARATAPTASENLFRGSDGLIHVAFLDNGDDLWYGNSSDDGATWNSKELAGGFLNHDNVGIVGDSNNFLYIYYEGTSVSPQIVRIINSTNNGSTWSTAADLFLGGYSSTPGEGARAGPTQPSCIMDKNDVIHCCAIENQTGLSYVNSSTFGNDTFIHQDSSDDSDWCDIAVDSSNNVCIVALGTDQQDIDVFCNIDSWQRHHVDDLSSMLTILTEANTPVITVDNDDMFHLAYSDPSGIMSVFYLKHANFTANNLTSFSIEVVDTQKSYYFDIGVSSQKDIWILYSNYTDLRTIKNGAIFSANKSYRSATWDKRTLVYPESNIPSILDSRYPCSNRMTDRLKYAWTEGNPAVLYNNQTIYYPSCFPPCNDNWIVNVEDKCENSIERNIYPYYFGSIGISDYFITYANIYASGVYLGHNGGVVSCEGGYLNKI